MKNKTYTHILAMISALSLLYGVPSTRAADSSSFTLYDDVSGVVDGSPLGSNSFSLNESGETWIAYPLTGSTFQIVTAPPTQDSSSSSSSSSSVSSSEQTDGGGSGGHRGSGTNTQKPPTAPSSPDTEPKPSAPSKPTPSVPVVQPDTGTTVDPLPDVDFVQDDDTEVVVYTTGDIRNERITYKPHFFDVTDNEAIDCYCEQFHTAATVMPFVQNPIVISLLLLLSFILGYLARVARPGYTAIPQKKSKPKKK